jgi:hypothetical protein
MLYPLSYEGGDAFPQVRPYFFASPDPCPSIPCPWRAQSIGEQRFLQRLLMVGIIGAVVNLLVNRVVLVAQTSPARCRVHEELCRCSSTRVRCGAENRVSCTASSGAASRPAWYPARSGGVHQTGATPRHTFKFHRSWWEVLGPRCRRCLTRMNALPAPTNRRGY